MTINILENEQVAKTEILKFCENFEKVRNETAKFIVGQQDVVEKVLISIICGGHVLIEGVPGLGKTALVNTLAKAMNIEFKRVQFTPDLLPADILGTNILVEKNGEKIFQFQKGPVFTNILLADEINRATPKTQSALLQTMQEKCVTVADHTYQLPKPFFVLATQNPIEMDGTYSLPEAQLDRFFFKLNVSFPSHDELSSILDRTTGLSSPEIKNVIHGEDILAMGDLAKQIPIDDTVKHIIVNLVRMTHPDSEGAPEVVKKYVRYGASPRAAQSILGAARVNALISGRFHVSKDDVKAVAKDALHHRILLSFEGEAEKISTKEIVSHIFESI